MKCTKTWFDRLYLFKYLFWKLNFICPLWSTRFFFVSTGWSIQFVFFYLVRKTWKNYFRKKSLKQKLFQMMGNLIKFLSFWKLVNIWLYGIFQSEASDFLPWKKTWHIFQKFYEFFWTDMIWLQKSATFNEFFRISVN